MSGYKNIYGRTAMQDLQANARIRVYSESYQRLKAERQNGLLIWLLSLAVTISALVFLGLFGLIKRLIKSF